MERPSSYSYSTQPNPTGHRYSGNSSAFSACANANEDWTKISDLAERRRIQNRIAQRNYRKKLKKRLEDLERRAASNSASPEQKPAQLSRKNSPQKTETKKAASVRAVPSNDLKRTPVLAARSPPTQYYPIHDDATNLFAQQSFRQLSTSPPPFSYPTYSQEVLTYGSYSQMPFGSLPVTCSDMPIYPSYLTPLTSSFQQTLPSMTYPVKQENLMADDEINPFNMNFASMAGIDVNAAQSYSDTSPEHTPPLSECFEQSVAGTPPDTSNCPGTPAFRPGTPALLPGTPSLVFTDDLLNTL